MEPEYNLSILQKKISKLEKKISQYKITEKTIKESEKTYRHIFEHSPVMVYRSHYNGAMIDINKAGAHLLGYKNRNDIIGRKAADFLYAHPCDRNRFKRMIRETGFIRDFETQFIRKDGSIIDVQITSNTLRDKKGNIEGYEGFIVDVTSRKQVERALLESEEKYRMVAENSLTGIFIHQQQYFRYANCRLAQMLGYDSPEKIIGKPFWSIVHPEDQSLVKRRGLKRAKTDFSPDQYPFRLLKKDGSAIWVELRATHAAYKGQPAVVGNFINITKGKQAEEEIRHLSHKIIEAGEKERKKIAADLHDEFGQSLTSMHFDLEALQRSLPEKFNEECNHIIGTVEKLADTVRNTTSYIRPDVLDHIGLIPALEWFIKEFKQRQSDLTIELVTIGLKKRLLPEIETVLYRIAQECLVNVKKHAKASMVNIMLTYNYPWIIFIVKDNGIGYRQAQSGLPRRLKTRGGIGLLSIRERVTSLHGNIDISSSPGKGTTIRIELPLD
jgi:PAS domain S-box-containing protein